MISLAGVSVPPMPEFGKPAMNSPLTTLMRAEIARSGDCMKLALPKEMPFRMGYMDAAAPESPAGP